jgi:hypothetical protein
MPQTYALNAIHVVFTTRDRAKLTAIKFSESSVALGDAEGKRTGLWIFSGLAGFH